MTLSFQHCWELRPVLAQLSLVGPLADLDRGRMDGGQVAIIRLVKTGGKVTGQLPPPLLCRTE